MTLFATSELRQFYMTLLKSVCLVMLIATSGIAQKNIPDEPFDVVTVCEVLSNRSFYNGKFVALVGLMWSGYHGSSLIAVCPEKIRTGDYFWESAVEMKYDSSSPTAFSKGVKVNESVAKRKIRELKARLKTNGENGEDSRWHVVFGRIETKTDLEAHNGYGHLGSAPAQIIYKQNDQMPITIK